MGDFILIPLSNLAEEALQGAVSGDDAHQALVRRLQAHTAGGVLTVSHADLEKLLMHLLSCPASNVPE